MTTLAAHIAKAANTHAAVGEAAALVARANRPNLLVTFYGEQHDDQIVRSVLASKFPGVPYLGGTSSRGVIGVSHLPSPEDFGLLAIYDETGDYGIGAAVIGTDPKRAAERALHEALDSCGCMGMLPRLVWVFQPPGHEEAVLDGVKNTLGNRCPIVGGSAGDDTVAGHWRQISHGHAGADVVAVAVFFPTAPVSATFQSGYAPTDHRGRVTASRGRTLIEIDGQPAGKVYDAWRDGVAGREQAATGSILAASALDPIGVPSRTVAGIVQYRLVHPASLTSEGHLATFAEIAEGTTVELMSGSQEGLALRAGRVLDDAVAGLPDEDMFAGALLVYCGGCAMSLGDHMPLLGQSVDRAARAKPVLGVLTFGEQGPLGDESVHANLMVSAVAFGSMG